MPAHDILTDMLTAAIRRFLIEVFEVGEEEADHLIGTVDLNAVASGARRWTDIAASIVASIGIGKKSTPDDGPTVDLTPPKE